MLFNSASGLRFRRLKSRRKKLGAELVRPKTVPSLMQPFSDETET
jgi:hypothetical protein